MARLRQLMKEHLLHIAPENIAATPKIKRRKKIELNRHTCNFTTWLLIRKKEEPLNSLRANPSIQSHRSATL